MPERYYNLQLVFKNSVPEGKVGWQSPSNIALVKYWGKKPVQIPCNPSVSFTLSKSNTKTIVNYRPAGNEKGTVSLYFYNELQNNNFSEKTKLFLDKLKFIFPFVQQLDIEIYTENTFPHSAGIASSASGMSALALCLCSIEQKHFATLNSEEDFFRKASFIARLGSGSAARSVYGGVVGWGYSPGLSGSSDYFGIPLSDFVNKEFLTYQDTILIVDEGEKKVSSSIGHALMKTNPFAEKRFDQAKKNTLSLIKAMQQGDFSGFISITESEALTLHAMMMTSDPYYLLLKANTLRIIEKVFEFRNDTGLPVSFTLDAGPNIHLLYPKKIKTEVKAFVDDELLPFTHNNVVIYDQTGKGPIKLY